MKEKKRSEHDSFQEGARNITMVEMVVGGDVILRTVKELTFGLKQKKEIR